MEHGYTYPVASNTAIWSVTRGDPGFTKVGEQIHCSEHDNCVRSTRSGMQSMPNLGGLGHDPQKILIESEGIFNGLLPGLLQGSTLQNNYSTAIWSSSRLHYLSKKLHYFTEGLHYHNKVNLKGTLLDMNHITTLRIQSMNIVIC